MTTTTDLKYYAGKCSIRRGAIPLVVLLASALGACQTAPTAPQQTMRTVSETAPADLQLLCANAAAQAGGVEPSRVLPISSRRLDARSYQVELNAAGQTTSCVVDDDGNIVSVGAA